MNNVIIKRIKAPNGFRFVISTPVECENGFDFKYVKLSKSKLKDKRSIYEEVYVKLVRNSDSESIGTISLYRYSDRNKWYETHSQLDERYRNKGFGALLYSRAIQFCLENGYRVRSSSGPSDDALRVWNGQSIRKRFEIRKRLADYGRTTYFAYAKSA